MPLTKLARRYHLQRRPDAESSLNSPGVKKVLEFETPEPPPFVTVRKKKAQKQTVKARPTSLDLDTLHTTVIESANFPVTDCQGWKRLESTHIDHVADALGHMTIFTEDISTIHPDETFKTALEEQDRKEDFAPIIFADDSEEVIKSASPSLRNSSNIAVISESPASSTIVRVSKWVLDSPFQSPRPSPPKFDTIVISESSDEDSDLHFIENSENTSKAYDCGNREDSHFEPSVLPSSPSKNDHIRQSESINVLWKLTSSFQEPQKETNHQEIGNLLNPTTSNVQSTSPIKNRQQCVDKSIQVSFNHDDTDSESSQSEEDSNQEEKNANTDEHECESRSVSLQVSLNSSISSDDDTEEIKPRLLRPHAVQSQKILSSSSSSSTAATAASAASENEAGDEVEASPSPAFPSGFLSNNTLSDVLEDEKRDSQGHVLFLDDHGE